MSHMSVIGCGLLLAAVMGCGPQRTPAAAPEARPPDRASARTLVMASNTEVLSLLPKMLGPTNPIRTTRTFNAALALTDSRGESRPYLAEDLPRLDTPSWVLLPGGGMETTWRLRPGLTWHDSQPLTAEDFAFAWRVYAHPGLGTFVPKPQDRIDEVRAPDARTLVIRWKATYADAGAIVPADLDPLPRHVLLAAFTTYEENPESREAFLSHRYWSTEYVGTGPYRLTAWEPGAHLEGVAFEGHALGRPRIDRVVVRFIADENVVFTNILSGNVHYTLQQALRFEQAALLRQQWAVNGQGVVLHIPTSTSTAAVQLRPDYLQTPALSDLRVRRAIAHAIDRAGLLDGLFDGQGPIVATFVGQDEPFYPVVDRVVAKYPYDPRRAETLMNEVGYRKDRDGLFADEGGERFQSAFWVTAGTQTERLMAIITDTWQRTGFDIRPRVIPAAEARDNQARSTFPGILNYGISASSVTAVESLTRAQIGNPANRWGGQNRGGWSSTEYNRVFETFENTLDRDGRIQRLAELARIISEDLPNYPLFSNLGAITHLSSLTGPEVGTPDTLVHWNIHEWELR